jgi:hypothetical protein
MTTRIRTILKYGLALLLLSFWLAPASFAQGRGVNPEQMQERMEAQNEETIKELGLPKAKADLVRPILQTSLEKRMDLMKNRQDRQAMRAKMGDLDQETETKLAEVLSKEEMVKYKKIQEERAAQRGNRRGDGRQGGTF